MQKWVIRNRPTVDDPRKKWQTLLFNKQLMSGIFQFIEAYGIFEQYIHKVVLRFFNPLVHTALPMRLL